MAVYLLQEDASGAQRTAIADRLRRTIPDLVDTASLDAIVKAAAKAEPGERPIVLVVVPAGARDYGDRIAKLAAAHGRDFLFMIVGDEISASAYKRLIRSGIADWASRNADPGEIAEAVARLRQQADSTAAARSGGGRPITIAFVPSAGGVGNTTLLIETAAYLNSGKSGRRRKICIVDLDFQTSHVCDYLDSEPRLNMAELSSAPERLDEHLLESFRTRHSSGIDIFAAPRSKLYADAVNISALDALFSMIAPRYELVLIDFPVTWYPWTAQVIAASDAAVITGVNTIPCLRQLAETLAVVRSSGSTALQIAIVINRCERTLLGAIPRRRHVEMVLRDERVFFIGNRPEAVESVNIGVPMTLGAAASRVAKEFVPLVEFCAGVRASHLAPG